MDNCFPVRTTKRKSTDLPWINKAIKRRIRRRKRIYIKEGRSLLWKSLKAEKDEMIRVRKKGYMDNKKVQLTDRDAN